MRFSSPREWFEYLIDGVNQVQVNSFKNVTFANTLRSILRQDPNVILVGEIRDRETADIAFRSSLTGHLVLSTLHTNSSVATVTRLADIGLEAYLISSSLSLVVAQRLVRLNCKYCAVDYDPDRHIMEIFCAYLDRFRTRSFKRGTGCEHCNYTGFYGRTAIFEMLAMNEEIRYLISHRKREEEIFEAAKKNGLRTLAESGIALVVRGVTTLEEISSACALNEMEAKHMIKTI
jgi:type IV pilus assembly protein PilB